MLRAIDRVLAPQYEVTCCRTSREALQRAAACTPDIALLDVRMPDLSGFELRDALRGLCPDLDVIFMTGSLNHLDTTFVHAIRAHAFYFVQKPFDREVLLTLFERCLELRRLSAENRRHTARLEAELGAARTFQKSLLPPSSARLEGVAIEARYLPCTELGGDFYDYASPGPGRATLLIADVAGHGVSAAMLTGVVKAAFDASGAYEYEPRAVVRRIADGVRRFDLERYVTVLCVRIDRTRGTLEYVNAGHPPGVLWSDAGTIVHLESTGLFVSSAFPDTEWAQPVEPIRPGGRVLLFTDGLCDRESGDEPFGRDRILDVIGKHPDAGATLLEGLLEAAGQFDGGAPPRDDVAIVTATVA